MDKAYSFSDIDQYIKLMGTKIGCLCDTNFLISLSDKDHTFHEDSQFLFEKLVEHQIPLYVSVTARSEFIDFHRRVIMTETLMDMLAASSKWKISSAVREVLKSQKGWLDNQTKDDDEPYLPDSRLKKCKQAFLPKTESGQMGWVALCREYLSGRLLKAWNEISVSLSLNYMDTRTEDTKKLMRKELKWEEMYRLAEESALGSHDAMILNIFNSSSLNFLISTDYDLAYGVTLSAPDKSVLVPDGVYRNHIKKLRF